MTIYQPHSVKLFPDALGAAVVVPDILELNSPTDTEMRREVTGANQRVKHGAIVRVSAKPTFRTRAIDTILSNIGPEGLAVESEVNDGVVFVWQKNDDIGQTEEGSVHRTETYKKGLIYPTQLQVGGNRDDAEVTLEMAVIYDGSNDFKVVSDSVALPTISIAEKKFTIGPVVIGGNTLTDYTGMTIDFGANVETDSSESDVYDTHIKAITFMPTITLTGIDPTWFGTVGIEGDVAVHATDYIYLRQREQDETHFKDGSDHIKIAFGGLVAHEKTQFQAAKSGETSLTIAPFEDASGNAPIIITTGVALP